MILILVLKGETGGGISRDQFIDNTATDILKRIPPIYEIDKIRKKYGLDVTPTTVVLLQELERFNRLISTMFRSLTTLKRVKLLSFSFSIVKLAIFTTTKRL